MDWAAIGIEAGRRLELLDRVIEEGRRLPWPDGGGATFSWCGDGASEMWAHEGGDAIECLQGRLRTDRLLPVHVDVIRAAPECRHCGSVVAWCLDAAGAPAVRLVVGVTDLVASRGRVRPGDDCRLPVSGVAARPWRVFRDEEDFREHGMRTPGGRRLAVGFVTCLASTEPDAEVTARDNVALLAARVTACERRPGIAGGPAWVHARIATRAFELDVALPGDEAVAAGAIVQGALELHATLEEARPLA